LIISRSVRVFPFSTIEIFGREYYNIMRLHNSGLKEKGSVRKHYERPNKIIIQG